jgi:hypothetical protein
VWCGAGPGQRGACLKVLDQLARLKADAALEVRQLGVLGHHHHAAVLGDVAHQAPDVAQVACSRIGAGWGGVGAVGRSG